MSKSSLQNNNLLTNNPDLAKEWDYEKNNLNPNEVAPFSHKKVWWICDRRHSWEAQVSSRNKDNRGCPYCSNQKVGYGNDLATKHPDLAKEWDYEKNEKKPEELFPTSHKKVWWICDKNHSYQQLLSARTRQNQGCPYCYGRYATDQDNLLVNNPDLAKEWDYEKNKKRPEDFKEYSSTQVWWICSEGHSYKKAIEGRSNGRNCSYCSNQKVGYGNDLATKHPDLAKEWDYEKNKKRPEDYVSKSNKKAWWICKKNHSYFSSISTRSRLNVGCPYCSNKAVGYGNDFATNYPKLAKYWDYEKNKTKPNQFTGGSNKSVWWICQQGHSHKQRINNKTSGIGCPYCVLTPRSKEEVYLLFELKEFFSINENDHKIKLKTVQDVDIKISDLKIVIEFDGAYWHRDRGERDIKKTNDLRKSGWTVIRVREKPLRILSRKYNVSSESGKYKETSNKVLKKINQLGYEVSQLDKYLKRNTLINQKNADKYISKLLEEKNN